MDINVLPWEFVQASVEVIFFPWKLVQAPMEVYLPARESEQESAHGCTWNVPLLV